MSPIIPLTRAGALVAAVALHLAAADPLLFPSTPVPGGVALVPLGNFKQTPVVQFHGERVLVRKAGQGLQAVVGIPLNTKPGLEELQVDGRAVKFTVKSRRYPEQHLKLENKRQVHPEAEDEARIAREQALIGPAWKKWPEGVTPTFRFQEPTQGKGNSFGLRRFFNGEARAPHSGLDIPAPSGQPVRAPAEGVVVLTGDFFFSGNSVFLAHGEGLVTLYCHLSEIAVKSEQRVQAGELLGKVGKTGRATGPHLHWAVSLNNARIDPRLFLAPF